MSGGVGPDMLLQIILSRIPVSIVPMYVHLAVVTS